MTIPLLRDVSLNSSGIVCELSGIAEQARTPSQIRRPATSISLPGGKTLPAENLNPKGLYADSQELWARGQRLGEEPE
jgi:hypothetical protein